MKKIVILGILGIVCLTAVSVWMQHKAKEKGKIHFQAFNLADIDSEIESVGIALKGTKLKLVNGEEFVFYPVTNISLNGNEIFRMKAKKGDKVIKKVQSDTLYLFQGTNKLSYTFIVFD
jgi:type II secretory pathway pseudopilin PulG